MVVELSSKDGFFITTTLRANQEEEILTAKEAFLRKNPVKDYNTEVISDVEKTPEGYWEVTIKHQLLED